jgi:ferredoxin-NADP reductase
VIVDGTPHLRSYSMSSAPGVDSALQVTVKRVSGGPVSGWLTDKLQVGDVLDVSVPAGAFLLTESDDDIVAFAAGSGITPIVSMTKSTLHASGRTMHLLLANQDRDSAIFAGVLDDLAVQFPDRFRLHHHRDDVSGFVDEDAVTSFLGDHRDAQFYLCGPTGFMDVVRAALSRAGVAAERIHLERFTPAEPTSVTPAAERHVDGDEAPSIAITMGTETKTMVQREGLTVLESARWSGLRAPSSCEAGHCATCMALVVEGEVTMSVNHILTDEEVDEGWVLTCQAVPLSPVVRVVYET